MPIIHRKTYSTKCSFTRKVIANEITVMLPQYFNSNICQISIKIIGNQIFCIFLLNTKTSFSTSFRFHENPQKPKWRLFV